MAKYENEGYCPAIWVPTTWTDETDPRLIGLWSIVSSSIVYEKNSNYQTASKEIWGSDPISYDLLAAMIRKNPCAEKILVHQSDLEIMKVFSEVTSPELVLHAGSNFAIILADARYGMDVWVFDLRNI